MKRNMHVMRWLQKKHDTLILKNMELDEQIMSNNKVIKKEGLPLISLNWQKYRVKFPMNKFADFMSHMKTLEDVSKKTNRKKERSKSKKKTAVAVNQFEQT